MGSTHRGERPPHQAEVAPFEMCRTEVTQAQWTAVMSTRPFDPQLGLGDERPAQNITWEQAVSYMVSLTKRENELRAQQGSTLTQCYARIAGEWEWMNPDCTGYRLPTETEWEYAARAGTSTDYPFDDESRGLYAWSDAKMKFEVQPVARLRANAWGLFDMQGNVLEWVWDRYRAEGYEAGAGRLGYSGPTSGLARVIRGGSVLSDTESLRSAYRFGKLSHDTIGLVGFRCARSLGPSD
ncbi:MAG: formylglycine-generating enzyme family protein [Myxococcales bacterium]|nr:formylglycine-generating enzyme family protein [Myxococcales bacterium]